VQHLYLNLNVSAAGALHLAHRHIYSNTLPDSRRRRYKKIYINIHICKYKRPTHTLTQGKQQFSHKVGLKSFENRKKIKRFKKFRYDLIDV